MKPARAVGIDLGSTHTVAAVMAAAGHTEVLRNQEGDALLPSIVVFGDDRTIVGREAELFGRGNPARLAACAKRSLGKEHYEQRIGGYAIPPEVIQASILVELRKKFLGGGELPVRAAIAIPAHFRESQKQATRMAADIAGLPLLDLVPEPVAAALAFAESTPQMTLASPTGEPTYFLVYDLGGYTFEASALSITTGKIELLATIRDDQLGGHDWDRRLVDRLADEVVKAQGIDPRQQPQLLEPLVRQAVQLKHALGVRSQAAVRVACHAARVNVTLTRAEFEQLTADLAERTIRHCERALQQAKIVGKKLQVLLVGGATRMPMIRQAIAARLHCEPDSRVCPDEAVARGAAIYAARALVGGNDRPPPLQVKGISTHSLGIMGVDQATGARVHKVLIPKGTPLPAEVTREFITGHDAQRTIVFRVLEGESSNPDECATIGRVTLRDLPPTMTEQWPVEVKYRYGSDGRLQVDAHVRYTQCQTHLEAIRPAGVSEVHVHKWRPVVQAQAGFAAYQQVFAWLRAAEAPPPVALAGGAPSPPPAEEEKPEPAGPLAVLKRLLPTLFGSSRSAAAEESSGDAKS
jgi:molecular chaperone DnaK (HSP70)